jgi:ParB-like nuclease family protein
MSKGIMVPFSRLVLYHNEIGIHRGRRAGFRDVFGFDTLYGRPFTKLASKVKDAYEGRRVPSHEGWQDQREALRWFVEKGRDGIYALDSKPLCVTPSPYQHYYITDGHHRGLALYILGESEVRARVRY